MKLRVLFDIDDADIFSLLHLAETLAGGARVSAELQPLVNPVVCGIIDEWARRRAVEVGRETPPPVRTVVFDLSEVQTWQLVLTLRTIAGLLRGGPGNFCRGAAELAETLRRNIGATVLEEAAPSKTMEVN